jgi:ABC-type polysaccharide/polyol phosphate transport system ATPase subunit
MHGVWKRYGLPLPRWLRPREQWLRLMGNGGPHSPREDGHSWVLRDINLEVRRGETVAIVGRTAPPKAPCSSSSSA